MPPPDEAALRDERLLETLQQLLTIQAPALRPALDQASDLVNQALEAEKVDVFLYEPATDSLVALGTSQTPMGRRQYELGLNRQPLSNRSPTVEVFRTGEPYLNGRVDQDPRQPRGLVEGLGVRSEMDVPLVINGERRGALHAASSVPERFMPRDLRFLQAVAGWIGMVTHRAELFEQETAQAFERGRRQASEELAQLTARQREVAACVAEGLSNEEIAERLVLSPGTVANHLEHCLSRLGLKNRTQLAVWAVERGLYRSGQPRDDKQGGATGSSDELTDWLAGLWDR